MVKNRFIQDLTALEDANSIYRVAFGYLVGWLRDECRLTNNGQISRAEVLAKIDFVSDAVELAFDYHNPGRGA